MLSIVIARFVGLSFNLEYSRSVVADLRDREATLRESAFRVEKYSTISYYVTVAFAKAGVKTQISVCRDQFLHFSRTRAKFVLNYL